MRVINIFPSTKSYFDVVELLYCIDQKVDESIIISRDDHPVPSHVTRTRYILSPPGLRGLRFWWWAAKEAKQVIRSSESPEDWVVIDQTVGITVFILRYLLWMRCPTIVFFVFPVLNFFFRSGWNDDPWARPLRPRQRLAYFLDWVKRTVVEAVGVFSADLIAANSPEILDSNGRFKPSAPRMLLPNSVRPICPDPRNSRSNENRLNVIFVAAVQPHKGVGSALEIFSRFSQLFDGARLTIVGGAFPYDKAWFDTLLSVYQRKCRNPIEYKGKIPFQELRGVYAEADVFLFPTFCEGSPRVVQEALQYGCVVATTDIPGNRVIDPDAEVLQFFPVKDVDRAVSILLKLASDDAERRRLSVKGQQLMAQNFSPEIVGNIFFEMCSRIHSNPGPSRNVAANIHERGCV